jgi:Tfp pilus assembly protein PilE
MNKMIKPNRKLNSRGFLSLEAGLVLLVVAIMIVAAVIYYRDNLRKTSVNTNISQLLATASAGRSTFGQTNQYANVTTATAVLSNTGAVFDALQITWPNVPTNQCIDIVMGIEGEARQVQVAGADVKAVDSPINLANVTAQCASAQTVVIDMFVGRN